METTWNNAWCAFYASLQKDGWSDEKINVFRARMNRTEGGAKVWELMNEVGGDFNGEN